MRWLSTFVHLFETLTLASLLILLQIKFIFIELRVLPILDPKIHEIFALELENSTNSHPLSVLSVGHSTDQLSGYVTILLGNFLFA